MTLFYKNNAYSQLAVAIGAGALTLTLPTGEGARFPALGGGDTFDVTVEDLQAGTREIMLCTARAGDVLTVTRAQEGTVAQAFAIGAVVENRLTAGRISAFQVKNTNIDLPVGGTINWGAGDILATGTANALSFTGASSGYSFDAPIKLPNLGRLDWANGNVTQVHTTGTLTFTAATGIILTDGTINHRIALFSGGQVFTGTFSNHQVNMQANNAVIQSWTGTGTTIAVPLTLSAGQIAFPGTQNPSANANTFDDYEEGTSTPSVTSGSGTITTASAALQYTKLGRHVCFNSQITITTNGTGASYIQFTVPFTNSGGEAALSSGRDQATGAGMAGGVQGGNTFIFRFDGAYPGVSGHTYVVGAQYPAT